MTAWLVAAAPASAYLHGLTVATALSPTNSNDKGVAISCPGGRVALGGQALTLPLPPFVSLTAVTGFHVGALETRETSVVWSVLGYAICAVQGVTAPRAGGAATYVKAVEYVSARSGLSRSQKAVTAHCSAGKRVISGGGRTDPSVREVGFRLMQRVAGGNSWQVRAGSPYASVAPWRVTASAVCANITTETPTSDYAGSSTSIVTSTSSLPGTARVTQSASCPAGTSVVGGGAEVIDSPVGAVLQRSEPVISPSSWIAESLDIPSTLAHSRLRVTAVCAALNGGPPA